MKLRCLFITLFIGLLSHAQPATEYQSPPEEILELVNAPLAPSVWMTDSGEHMLLLYRSAYKTIAELSEPELRLAGLRINPETNIGSRTTYYNDIRIKRPGEKESKPVSGLPEQPRLANFRPAPECQSAGCDQLV